MKKKQKDWIIADYSRGHLWCLAICSKDSGKNWYLIEWVNMSNLSKDKLHKAMMMGYDTMIEAKGDTDYKYVQDKYTFNPEDLDQDYWKDLVLPYSKFTGKTSIPYGKSKINKSVYEREIKRLLGKDMKKTEKDGLEVIVKAVYKSVLKAFYDKKRKKDSQEIIEDILDPNYIAEVDPDKIPPRKDSVINKSNSVCKACGLKELGDNSCKCAKSQEKGVNKLKKYMKKNIFDIDTGKKVPMKERAKRAQVQREDQTQGIGSPAAKKIKTYQKRSRAAKVAASNRQKKKMTKDEPIPGLYQK